MISKKADTKFTIQFNRSDPAHLHVVKLLNDQGFHGKAQYIVDAVLHYENSDVKQRMECPPLIDEKYIEVIVKRLLRETKAVTTDSPKQHGDNPTVEIQASSLHEITEDVDYDEAMEALGEDGFNAVAGALDMFRRK
jgi:hypothetical protein